MYEQTFCNTEEEERGEGKRLLDRVDERCELLKKEFETRMKRLEEQLTKTEQEFSQSRCDIEELQSMEKEYINQGIQTDLRCEDIEKIQEVAEAVKSTSPNEIRNGKKITEIWSSSRIKRRSLYGIHHLYPFIPYVDNYPHMSMKKTYVIIIARK
ncbi:unnamed protein product [Rhizopus stolonifer]